jgi:hypothetical protein
VTVLVLVLETLLVDVWMRVHVVAVTVLVLVLGVLVVVAGMRVLVLEVPMAVFMRVGLIVLVVVMTHPWLTSFLDVLAAAISRAAATKPEDREVGEAGFVAETPANRAPDRVEFGGFDRGHAAAPLAG